MILLATALFPVLGIQAWQYAAFSGLEYSTNIGASHHGR